MDVAQRYGPSDEAQAQAVFDAARRLELDSAPRKHHLVPEFYLRRWANEDDRVRVTEIDDHRSYVTNVDKAARETDFYSLRDEGVSPEELPPLLHEMFLSVVETWGQRWITEALALPPGALPQLEIDPQLTVNFCWFLSLTVTRGRSFRLEDAAMSVGMYRAWLGAHTDDGIRARLREEGLEPTDDVVAEHRAFLDGVVDGSIEVQVPRAKSVARAGQLAKDIGEFFFERTWAIVRTPPILPTCDEPVVTIGGPGAPRDVRAGLGIAGLVVLPLAPGALLAMFDEDVADYAFATGALELTRHETLEISREVIANATRWAFEHPKRRLTERLRVPRLPPSVTLEERSATTRKGQPAELIRMARVTRWAGHLAETPPWPVDRWWDSGFRYPQFGPPPPT